MTTSVTAPITLGEKFANQKYHMLGLKR